MSTQKLLSEITQDEAKEARKTHVHFAVILYEESLEHMNMLEYLLTHEYLFEVVYIMHDQDVYFEDDKAVKDGKAKVGDHKKNHYHVYIHAHNRMTKSSFLKYFAVWIDHVEVISSPGSYVAYMLHDTPDSMKKHFYPATNLKGDNKLIRKYTQNGNFVQLGEVIQHLSQNHGSMLRLLQDVVSEGRKDIMETVKEYQSLICTASNQEYRRYISMEEKNVKNNRN